MRLVPGDIVLERGEGFLPSAIRFFTRAIGESRTKVNHVGVIVDGGTDPIIVESLRIVKRHAFLPAYAGVQVAIYRPRNLSVIQLVRLAEKAESYVGREYGHWKVAMHALDWALQGAYVFRRLAQMERYPICSWLVAKAYAHVGVRFGVAPGAATPDDVWDHVTTNPEEFKCIHPLSVLR